MSVHGIGAQPYNAYAAQNRVQFSGRKAPQDGAVKSGFDPTCGVGTCAIACCALPVIAILGGIALAVGKLRKLLPGQ